MKNSSWLSPSVSLSTAGLIAVLSAATGSVGCGGDDPEVEQDAGSVIGSTDSGKPSTSGSKLAMNFVASCTDTIDVGCAEFSGEEADAEIIKAAASKSCDQGGESLKTEPCPTAKLVATCLTQASDRGAQRWLKEFYYEPKTEAQAKAICMGGKFEPTK